MLDITGVGSLNVDLKLTAEKFNSILMQIAGEIIKKMKYGGEKMVGLNEIEDIISSLEHDSLYTALGGSAFNTIKAISALNTGIKTGFVGVTGDTQNKLSFISLMKKCGIDSKFVNISKEPAGRCICVNHKGVRSFLYYPGCNRKMGDYLNTNCNEIIQYLANSRMLHITQFPEERENSGAYTKNKCD